MGSRDTRAVRRTGLIHPQQSCDFVAPQPSWRWRDSNPRHRTTVWVFYGRSRWKDLALGLPPAEDPSASPGAMSLEGPRAEPSR
jgi:hypothetical protein